MKRIWVCNIHVKERNGGYIHQIKSDRPEKLLKHLLDTIKKATWAEIKKVEILRAIDDVFHKTIIEEECKHS